MKKKSIFDKQIVIKTTPRKIINAICRDIGAGYECVINFLCQRYLTVLGIAMWYVSCWLVVLSGHSISIGLKTMNYLIFSVGFLLFWTWFIIGSERHFEIMEAIKHD